MGKYIPIYALMFPLHIFAINYNTPINKGFIRIKVNKMLRIALGIYKQSDKINVSILISQFALVCNIVVTLISAIGQFPETLDSVLHVNEFGFSSSLFFLQYGGVSLAAVDMIIYDIVSRMK